MEDKDKLIEFADFLFTMSLPDVEDEKAKDILNDAVNGIYKIAGTLNKEAERL